MKCQNCGFEIPETASFCNNCGAKIVKADNTQKENNTPIQPPALEQEALQKTPMSISRTSVPTENPIPPFYSEPYPPPAGNYQQQNANPYVNYQGYVSTEMPDYAKSGMPDYGKPNTNTSTEDKKSVGLNLLSWFVPLAGIILYFVNREEKPIRSKSNLKCAIVSIIVNTVLIILSTVLIIFGAFASIDYLQPDDSSDYIGTYEETSWTDDDYLSDYLSDTTSSSKSNNSSDYSSEVNSYKDIVIDGKKVSFPMSYSDFEAATGYSIGADDKVNTLKGNNYNIIAARNGERRLQLYIANNTTSVIPQSECTVSGVSVSYYSADNKNPSLSSLGGVSLGSSMSRDNIVSAIGKAPDDERTSEYGYTYITYYEDYDLYYSQNAYEITINDDGVISEISVKALH